MQAKVKEKEKEKENRRRSEMVMVMVMVMVRTDDLTNYGSRVLVDTAPGPVFVYRALKSLPLIPAVKTDSWNLSLRQRRPPPQNCTCGPCNCTTGTSTTKCTATGKSQ